MQLCGLEEVHDFMCSSYAAIVYLCFMFYVCHNSNFCLAEASKFSNISFFCSFGCESHLQSTATGMMVPRFLTLDLHSYLKLVSVANYGAAYLAKVAQSKVLNKHLYSLTSWGADLPWTLREGGILRASGCLFLFSFQLPDLVTCQCR